MKTFYFKFLEIVAKRLIVNTYTKVKTLVLCFYILLLMPIFITTKKFVHSVKQI